ncbi:hypothetical protein HY621_00495 [Candidatus Uhrbacteria bacterium]|nr:hypothetical protein [Candidatus Uhrbacteria bacterium]
MINGSYTKNDLLSFARTASVLVLIITGFLFLGAACSLKTSAAKTPGLFKSVDKGATWKPKTIMFTAKGNKSRLADIEVVSLAIDPRNSNYVFMGTLQDGLYASENAGESWTLLIPSNRINDIAFDLSSRCVLYALTPKQLYKTSDCASSWDVILNETRSDVDLTSMVLDTLSPHILYVTTSAGDIFQSQDRGVTWKPLYRFSQTSIRKIIVDRYHPEILYIVTASGDIYRSGDRGFLWDLISGYIKKEYNSDTLYRGLIGLSREDSILFASRDALYRTINAGKTWQRLSLLTRQAETIIFALAVNPENDSEIYYTTRDTLYRTSDAGKTWQADPLPPQRSGSVIAIDPNNIAHMYLGLRALQKKSRFFYSPNEE